jgi:hypothetical protein
VVGQSNFLATDTTTPDTKMDSELRSEEPVMTIPDRKRLELHREFVVTLSLRSTKSESLNTGSG